MAIRRFDHAAINSRDIAASKAFYCGLLGLEEGKEVDMGEVILHYLYLPDGSAIELFDHKDRAAYEHLRKDEGHLKHYAFKVDDIDGINARLVQAGTSFAMPLCELGPLKVRALLCLDPDGVVVELSEANK